MRRGLSDKRNVLQNAASVAGLLITTEASVSDKPEKAGSANNQAMGGMGNMGGGMPGMM